MNWKGHGKEEAIIKFEALMENTNNIFI